MQMVDALAERADEGRTKLR